MTLALLEELAALGVAPPAILPGVRVRFEGAPSRWPDVARGDAEFLLHAQVDTVQLDSSGAPDRLDTSATLFQGDRVVVRTTCSARRDGVQGKLRPPEVWTALTQRCARELLAPLQEPNAAGRPR